MSTKIDHALSRNIRNSTKETDKHLDRIATIINYDVTRVAKIAGGDGSDPEHDLSRIAKRATRAIESQKERADRVRKAVSDDKVSDSDVRRLHSLIKDAEDCKVVLLGLIAGIEHVANLSPTGSVKSSCSMMLPDLKASADAATAGLNADIAAAETIINACEER